MAGMVLPFLEPARPSIGFDLHDINGHPVVDSLSVDLHKAGLTPYPCGVFVCRTAHRRAIEIPRPFDPGRFDATVAGSRPGAAAAAAWAVVAARGRSGGAGERGFSTEAARAVEQRQAELAQVRPGVRMPRPDASASHRRGSNGARFEAANHAVQQSLDGERPESTLSILDRDFLLFDAAASAADGRITRADLGAVHASISLTPEQVFCLVNQDSPLYLTSIFSVLPDYWRNVDLLTAKQQVTFEKFLLPLLCGVACRGLAGMGNCRGSGLIEADLLLATGRSAEARAAYTKTLEREPGRARSVYGAARAAELAGDVAAAKQGYAAFLKLMEKADGDRAEIAAARRAVAVRD